jgi:hypothetical protein
MTDAAAKKMGDAIAAAVTKATAPWAKQRKSEERDRSNFSRRRERLMKSLEVSVKDAAYAVMEKAYLIASSNGSLPASARQVMYAARPAIQAETGKALYDQYFTQTLLPNYMADHGVDWNVVFDDRGHFTEPHTAHEIGIGTLSVRSYLAGNCEPQIYGAKLQGPEVGTSGAAGNFGAVLFIEKEGFFPLFEHVKLAERFDLAIMSTKGMSNTSARQLVESLCGGDGVPLLVLHDFDKAGFSIAATLGRDTRRYQFETPIKIINLGLRLEDVIDLGLEDASEATFDNGTIEARSANLAMNGATDAEIEFLLERRVELNALTSDQLVRFVEKKLADYGVKKVMPDDDVLAAVYRSNIHGAKISEIVDLAVADVIQEDLDVPDTLKHQVAEHLRLNPTWRWDRAIAEIVRVSGAPEESAS